MKKRKALLLFISCIICMASYGQYSAQTDSLAQKTQLSLDLKLSYTPVQLDINSDEINRSNRPIYLHSQLGMYEQFHITPGSSEMLRPYKAHYPTGLITYSGTNRIRDSFNPHGSNDIGSALINGFLNGILLGNKY